MEPSLKRPTEYMWDDRYVNRHGFWRPYAKEVTYKKLTVFF